MKQVYIVTRNFDSSLPDCDDYRDVALEPSLTIGPDMLIHAVTLSKEAARG